MVNGEPQQVVLQHVLFTPELAKNLVSTALITCNRHQIQMNHNGCQVCTANSKIILQV